MVVVVCHAVPQCFTAVYCETTQNSTPSILRCIINMNNRGRKFRRNTKMRKYINILLLQLQTQLNQNSTITYLSSPRNEHNIAHYDHHLNYYIYIYVL
jgi:hypothetical protein